MKVITYHVCCCVILTHVRSLIIVYDEEISIPRQIDKLKNNTSLILLNTQTLSNLHNAVSVALDQKETVMSFTKLYNYLESSGVDHYGFATSIRELFSFVKDDSLKSCLRYTTSFFQIVRLTIISLSKRKIAVITDKSDCSRTFFKELKNDIYMYGKLSENDYQIFHHELSNDINRRDNLKEFFYNLNTFGTTNVVVLTVRDTYPILFNTASRYRMTSSSITWLIPYYEKEIKIGNLPKVLLTFEETGSHIINTFMIDTLLYTYGEAKIQCGNDKNSYQLKEKIHSCINSKLYETLMTRSSNYNYTIHVTYESFERPNEWMRTNAIIRDKKLILMDTDVTMLQSVNDIQTRDVLHAVTLLDHPYSMVSSPDYDTVKDECYHGIKCKHENETTCCVGFVIDIFQGILEELNIDVMMHIVKDGKYGAIKEGEWNGLVGELIRGEAEVALAQLSITNERFTVIDYTTTFSLEMVAFLVLPQVEKLDLVNWKFIAPLETNLQILLWLLTLVIIIFIFLCENNVYMISMAVKGNKRREKYYGLIECMTYVTGVFLQRDLGGKNPSRLGARVLSIVYAFGMFVFITTYTAILAAQSLQNIEVNPFTGSEDPRIRYPTTSFKFGTQKSTSYETLFENGETEKLKTMNKFMQTNELFYDNVTDGVSKLMTGSLQAIIGDYSSLRYWLSKDSSCETRLIKDNLFQAGVAFGLQKKSPWKPLIDQAMMKYTLSDEFKSISKKWFKETCQPNFFVTQKKELSITQFGGLIFILTLTMLVSVPLLIPEYIYYKYFQNKLSNWVKTKFNSTCRKKFSIQSNRMCRVNSRVH